MPRFVLTLCLLLSIFIASELVATQQEHHSLPSISYTKEIRPILSKHCFSCHGPDAEQRKAGLRLDIANDDVDFDYLLDRILSDDESEVMPPPTTNKPLTKEQINLVQRWIDLGAKYERHWAFQLPSKSAVPENIHPIDFFVDKQLKERGLVRSRRADASTLIRRLYLDLIGLPPTVQQAEEFIAEPTQENYERIVEQLLASPRYGELWARRWLDLARYADTNGYEKDRDRSIWPFRDWVIRAINQDMPFDQFTIEQLAGDMLPNATSDQIVATGFHRNTMLNEEGGIDPLEYRYYAMVDRVGTTGTTWLGLTTSCAQCHTHKYDPITHEDYFGMMAYFDNADEPDYFISTPKSKSKQQANRIRAQKLLSELPDKWPKPSDQYHGPSFEQAFRNWIEEQKKAVVKWQMIEPDSAKSNLPHLTLETDAVVYVSGDTTKHDTYTLSFSPQPKPITAIRLEALPDDRLPGFGPGLTFYEGRKGDFFLAEINVVVGGQKQKWKNAFHSYAKNQFGNNAVSAQLATDGDFQSGWSVAGRTGERHSAVFNLLEPIPANSEFVITMEFGRHFASSLGKFRISVADSNTPVHATRLQDQQLRRLFDDGVLKDEDIKSVFAMQAEQLKDEAEQIRRLQRTPPGTATMVMQERRDEHKRPTYLRHRGEFTQPKHLVLPRLPAALFHETDGDLPTNRLEFARWLVSGENPLTSRVVVNRHWAAFFGKGLVATIDDFGMQGEVPSHPQLLDFLAVELIDQGWSRKGLHRLIVTSQTYQQTSFVANTGNPPILERLLTRFPRKRLEGEVIRDSSLFASGLLSEKMFGPPVRPPQPEGAAANYSRSKWRASEGPDRFRRSIYTYQKRTAPFAMYTTFDAGSGEACLAKRDASNTPLQALTLMNDPMFVEIAEAYGKRMQQYAGETDEKLEHGFRLLLTRSPTQAERQMLRAFYDRHQNWAAVARVILCLDESITKN